MPRPRLPDPARLTRRHWTFGLLLAVATVLTIVGWEPIIAAVFRLLDRLLDLAGMVGRAWPLLVVALLAVATNPKTRKRLEQLWRSARARQAVGVAVLLAAGAAWAGWPATRGWLLAAGGVALLGGLAAWTLILPAQQVPELPAETLKDLSELQRLEKLAERAKLRSDLRAPALQFIIGSAVLAGAVLAFQQLAEDRAQAAADRGLARQGQASERFTRAIDQLGSDRTETRIGGIYGLEQIAQQAPDNRLAVTEVLVAYLHRRAPRASDEPPELELPVEPLASRVPDVQAALTVLGRRHIESDDPPLDLRNLDLTGAELSGAILSVANLPIPDPRAGADLRGSILIGADLHSAALIGADLRGADLRVADLTEAILARALLIDVDLATANLDDAILIEAIVTESDLTNAILADVDLTRGFLSYSDLSSADLSGADLTDGSLAGSDLSGAILGGADLTKAELAGAVADSSTKWPDGFDWRSAGVRMR